MLKEVLVNIYERDLQKLRTEITLYENDANLWKTGAQITNSGGNLCLHLIGTFKHYFGTTLGKTGFIRNRDGEFTSKDVSIAELLTEIDATSEIVAGTLQNLTDDDLAENYPQPYIGETVKTGWLLVHLLTHFEYHLGQINYHRRFFQDGGK